MATIEDLLYGDDGGGVEQMLGLPPPQRGRRGVPGIQDVLAGSQQTQAREQRQEPEQGQAPGMSTREQRRQMLEQEAWQMFLGQAGPKRPPMKLAWNEILGATLSPKLLPIIMERKMAPYYDQIEAQRAKRSAVDMLMGIYKERGPISTTRGVYDPERGQVVPGTEPLPKEEKRPQPINVPGRGLMDPESRQFIPGTEPPSKPTAPNLKYIPGRGLFDVGTRQFIPDTAGAKPGTVDKQSAQVMIEGRRRYTEALEQAEENIRIRDGIFGKALSPEQRREAEAQAESAYQSYVGTFGQGKDLEARLQELLAAGMSQEEAFAQLETEGYE